MFGGKVNSDLILNMIDDELVKEDFLKWLKEVEFPYISFMSLDSAIDSDSCWFDVAAKLDGDIGDGEYYLGANDYYVRRNKEAYSVLDTSNDKLLMAWIA